MVVDIVLLQDSAPIVIKVDSHLLAAMYPVPPEDGLAAGGDPHPRQSIRVDLVPLNDATPIVMLKGVSKNQSYNANPARD